LRSENGDICILRVCLDAVLEAIEEDGEVKVADDLGNRLKDKHAATARGRVPSKVSECTR